MRKTIFKKELLFVFDSKKVDRLDQEKIEIALFSNYLSGAPYYILKESILDLPCLEKALNEITLKQKTNLIPDLSDLFVVSDDLNIPPFIKKLFTEHDKVVFFVGAGVSKLYGLPLWRELSDAAIKHLHEKAQLINNFERSTIVRSFQDPKQKLSIFHDFLPKTSPGSLDFYKSILNPSGQIKTNPYDLLVQFQRPIFTSNIDNLLFEAIKNKLKRPTKEENSDVQPGKIAETIQNPIYSGFNEEIQIKSGVPYQIHGNFNSDPNSTILTIEDYLAAYKSGSGLSKFLQNLFNNHRVIFIGYSLEEFEILEYLFGKKDSINKHYALIPIFLNEINLLSVYKRYLERLNIEVVPYYLDFNGYERLIDLLQKWLDSINEIRTESHFEKIAFLESGVL